MIIHPTHASQPPPLGDLSTRELATLMARASHTGGSRPSHLEKVMRQRHATYDHIRTELIRRETLGVGVH